MESQICLILFVSLWMSQLISPSVVSAQTWVSFSRNRRDQATDREAWYTGLENRQKSRQA